MPTIIEQIIQSKRREIAERQARTPVEELRQRIAGLPRPRNFFAAVTKDGAKRLNLIAEIKKATPLGGVLRPDFNALRIATTCFDAGADAL